MRLYILMACLSIVLHAPASALELAPFKDELFAYPKLMEERDAGAYRVYDYQELRDINQRDEVVERRVHARYRDARVRRHQRDVAPMTEAGGIPHVAVGALKNASVIVAYLHGQGGNRQQGVNDFTFGGNFNRLKNLVQRSGGLYLSPDFSGFGKQGASEIGALLSYYSAHSPGARIIVACGSAGGAICRQLAQDAQITQKLGGLVLLGSTRDQRFISSSAFQARVPILLAHGSKDRVFPVGEQESFYQDVRKAQADYPIRFVRFETGTHGTPIRMLDWRETINWMLSN